MSIAQKLQDILDCKDAIKTSINNKGGSITAATPLADYATAIDNLPSGGDLDEFISKEAQGQLTEIVIPAGVTKIVNAAFHGQGLCTYIKIPASVISIGDSAFFKGSDGTTEVVLDIENGLQTIGSLAFRMNNIKRLILPNSVTTIDAQAFMFCYKLKYIEIGTDITYIGVNNFNYTREQNMVIICKAVNPPTLAGSVFPANYTTGKIYVPDASVNDYKAANVWSTLSQYIFPISDYTP